jgi:hypothetical protein
MKLRNFLGLSFSALSIFGLSACGGGDDPVREVPPPVHEAPGPVTYSIAGTVSGLAPGASLVISDNAGDALTIDANGTYVVSGRVVFNGRYTITITSQPIGQTCSVAHYSGSGITADVGSVDVTCSADTYTVAGSVVGLANGQSLALSNNGNDALAVNADGSFTFATPVPYNGSYAVTVGTQPVGQTCTVSNGSASAVVANVATISVTCSINTFTISGTVTGLKVGNQITLNNNGADAVIVPADGSFSFKTPVALNSAYAVTVTTSPAGQNCDLVNDSATAVVSDVANVKVICWTRPLYAYVIGREGDSVLLFAIGVDGSLIPMNTPSISTYPFFSVDAISLDVSGRIVNVEVLEAGENGIVTDNLRYPIGPDGELTGINAVTDPLTIAYASIGSTFSGRFAYTAADGVVTQSTVGIGGVLTPLTPSNVPSGEGQFLVVDPTEHFLYVASGSDGTIWQYNIRPDGTLQPMNPPTVSVPGVYPINMVIVPGPVSAPVLGG